MLHVCEYICLHCMHVCIPHVRMYACVQYVLGQHVCMHVSKHVHIHMGYRVRLARWDSGRCSPRSMQNPPPDTARSLGTYLSLSKSLCWAAHAQQRSESAEGECRGNKQAATFHRSAVVYYGARVSLCLPACIFRSMASETHGLAG